MSSTRRAVVDPGDLLLDDRAGVQLRRHVVRRRPDQLHPAVVCRLVRVGAHEGRQEAVVDVDQPLGEAGAEVRRHDLHVAGQHHEVDVADQLQRQASASAFVSGVTGHVVERDAGAARDRLEVGVVGDAREQISARRSPARTR